MELPVGADGGERFLLDGRGAKVDSFQNRRVEDVDASVDAVAHELDWLLHEAVYAAGMLGLVDDNTVFGGFFNFRHHNGTLLAVRAVEVGQLLEGVFADHIAIQNEEGAVILAENLLGKFEGPSGAEGFAFDTELDANVVFFFVL